MMGGTLLQAGPIKETTDQTSTPPPPPKKKELKKENPEKVFSAYYALIHQNTKLYKVLPVKLDDVGSKVK